MLQAVKRNDLKVKEAPKSVIADQVYNQLIRDFPATALDWIKTSEWVGPVDVPLGEIDFSNRANWMASHEPTKVNMHAKLIEEGKSKPIILCQLPGHDKLFVADAHHRLLASEKIGKEPNAYIAFVRPADVEQATTMHNLQFSGGSRLDGT